MSQDPLGNIWTTTYYSIRMLNTFISNIDNVYDLTAAEKRNWKAEAIAVKAFYYFELVRRYGPIVLVPKNIDVNADLAEMQIPRSHVDTCFNEIVRLLDEAIPDLLYGKERLISHKLFLSKEGAMALKARVLLYQASPLFNGNEYYVNFKGMLDKVTRELSMPSLLPYSRRVYEKSDLSLPYNKSGIASSNKRTISLKQVSTCERGICISAKSAFTSIFFGANTMGP